MDFEPYYRSVHLRKTLSICEEIWENHSSGKPIEDFLIDEFFSWVYSNQYFLLKKFRNEPRKILFINWIIYLLKMRDLPLNFIFAENDRDVLYLYKKCLNGRYEVINDIVSYVNNSFVSLLLIRSYLFDFYPTGILESLSLDYRESLRNIFKEYAFRFFADRLFSCNDKGFYRSLREILIYCLSSSTDEEQLRINLLKFFNDFKLEDNFFSFSTAVFKDIKVPWNFLGFKSKEKFLSKIGNTFSDLNLEDVKENKFYIENSLLDTYKDV